MNTLVLLRFSSALLQQTVDGRGQGSQLPVVELAAQQSRSHSHDAWPHQGIVQTCCNRQPDDPRDVCSTQY
jgi:hypothetical protein